MLVLDDTSCLLFSAESLIPASSALDEGLEVDDYGYNVYGRVLHVMKSEVPEEFVGKTIWGQ